MSQDQSHQTHPVTPRNNQAPQHTWQGFAAGAAANTVSPPPSLSMVTLAPPAPAQPLRRSPRKNPMAIWVLDPILKTAFPAHCKNLSLFTAWSEERRNKEMSRCRQSSQSCTEEAVRAQELDAILSRSSQSPAYAFEIVLGLVPPSLESASSDGALLQLAGRFAGSTYIPKGQSDTVSSVTGLTLKIGTAWRELRPQLFQCVQEVSMSRYNEMVVQITAYFRNRASWAAEDFKYEPGLAPVVQRIQQQAREVTELIAGYGMIVSGGLQSGHVTIAQAHRCWFDLFYPFARNLAGPRRMKRRSSGKVRHFQHRLSSGTNKCSSPLPLTRSRGNLSSSFRPSSSILSLLLLTGIISTSLRLWPRVSSTCLRDLAALWSAPLHRRWDMECSSSVSR